ncbi:FxsA family protein [Paracoccus aerodenitrificans]|uniref:FxsA family protein n=1 Tax=Paracoccus aerodenitrificans TaxID=3017781 RepID=UPI0022F0F929|nr:FxsA family protein [Paracoccus aerodenitrificans]WBU63804.1 FxsA family protein [Paracoccus aerodenitrificans]
MPILILFILIPIIEIALFIQVGGLIGLWPTIGLVLLSAVVGMMLIRSQGRRALADLQDSFRSMRDPTRPLAHGAMILFSGALMLTPGFFTDTVGLLLLIPAVRDWIMRLAGRRMTVTRSGFGFDDGKQPRHGWPGREEATIDGDYVVQDDPYTSRDDIELPPGDRSATKRNSGPRKPSGWTRPD